MARKRPRKSHLWGRPLPTGLVVAGRHAERNDDYGSAKSRFPQRPSCEETEPEGALAGFDSVCGPVEPRSGKRRVGRRSAALRPEAQSIRRFVIRPARRFTPDLVGLSLSVRFTFLIALRCLQARYLITCDRGETGTRGGEKLPFCVSRPDSFCVGL